MYQIEILLIKLQKDAGAVLHSNAPALANKELLLCKIGFVALLTIEEVKLSFLINQLNIHVFWSTEPIKVLR